MEPQLRGFLDLCILAAVAEEDSYGYQIIKDAPPASTFPVYALSDPATPRKTGRPLGYSREHNGRLRRVLLDHWSSAGGNSTASSGTRSQSRDRRLREEVRENEGRYLGELRTALRQQAKLPSSAIAEGVEFYPRAIDDHMEKAPREEAVARMGSLEDARAAVSTEVPPITSPNRTSEHGPSRTRHRARCHRACRSGFHSPWHASGFSPRSTWRSGWWWPRCGCSSRWPSSRVPSGVFAAFWGS